MPTYNSMTSRNSNLVPLEIADQIVQELPAASAVLARSRKVNLSGSQTRMPVASVLPVAYFVSGDTGLKQTTSMEWTGVDLVVEELAAIVPVPQAWLDDSQMDLFGEIRPRLVEALAEKIDAACLFGLDKPSTWSPSIYAGTLASGNVEVATAGSDLAVHIANINRMVAEDGFDVNGFVSKPGFKWELTAQRTTGATQFPIFQPDSVQDRLYGEPLNQVRSGGWDASEAKLIAGDWTKSVIGMRQDITFRIFDQGVISDGSGNVITNLMQQDSVAMRVVMRLAFATANPATRLNASAVTRYPFASLQATTANS